MSTTAAPVSLGPHLSIGSRRIPVILPRLGDPRLKLSAIIVTLQVLGQTVLEFKLSIAQILVTIGFCAVVDMSVTLRREGVLAWPASALLTGNSTAFILRASGTKHGDWWSLHGIEYFLLAASVALLVKYLVRPGGRHRFNPSNVGLVWVLLVVGPLHVFPQYLWWGPLEPPVLLALVVIAFGAVWILRAVRMLTMALAFLLPFVVLMALFAAGGRSFVAIWSEQAIGGFDYWLYICTSPELLIFVFFMMSDPGTAPKGKLARVLYGVGTALVASALILFQPTEYGIKVAILASLTTVCAIVPLIERQARWIAAKRAPASTEAAAAAASAAAAAGVDRAPADPARAADPAPSDPAPAAHPAPAPAPSRRPRLGPLRPASVAVVLIVFMAVAGTARLAGDHGLIFIERGLVGPRNAQ